MGDPARDLRRSKRYSLRAIPGHAGVILSVTLALYIASRLIAVPAWMAVILMAIAVTPLLLDVANIVLCARREARK